MPVPRKICHPSVVVLLFLLSLNNWWLWWFSQLFQWFLRLKRTRIQTIWSAWATKHKHKHTRLCASLRQVLTQLDLERKRSTAALSKQKWNSLVLTRSYLAVSTHTLGPVHLRRGGEGVASSTRHVRHLVWLTFFLFFLFFFFFFFSSLFLCACWSTPKATLFIRSFHLLLGPGYRVSPASHTKRCFSRYLVPATLFFTGPRETFTGKNKTKQKNVSRLMLHCG